MRQQLCKADTGATDAIAADAATDATADTSAANAATRASQRPSDHRPDGLLLGRASPRPAGI